MTLKCPECGGMNVPGSFYCTSCGATLNQGSSKKPKSPSLILFLVLVGIMALFGLVQLLQPRKIYEVDGKKYTLVGDYQKVEERLGTKTLDQLVGLGITKFLGISQEKDLFLLKTDKNRIVSLLMDGKKLVKVYDYDEPKMVYYSTSELDDIYDYQTYRLLQDNTEARKAERAKYQTDQEAIVLNSGTYTVGDDLNPGFYNLTVLDGIGNLFIYRDSRLRINEVVGANTGRSEMNALLTQNLRGVELQKGDTVVVSQVVIEFRIRVE